LFRIVQFDRLLKYVVVLTIAVSVGSYSIIQQLWDPNFSLFKIITIASLLSGAVIFILFTPFCARKIWRLVGYFDASLFPDLNGDVRSIDNGATRLIELSGSYYTDRKTTGRIQLSKVSDDVSRDVAYY
jgi:hypothetical protein